MSTPILLPEATLRQAVAQFKRVYPFHAKTYASQLATAKRIVRAGGVHPDDGLNGYLVGTLSKRNALLVQDHHCPCGEGVCCHRLAVCLTKIGEEIEHVARNMDALEANEVHELLAESEATQ